MAAKKSTNTALQQKVKVLAKLYDSGCKTEKDLKALSLQSILKIPDISVSDMTVITGADCKKQALFLFGRC